MLGSFFRADQGAVTTDWVALSAGIIVLGIVVAYSVMGDSHAYLDQKFDTLNADIANGRDELANVARDITLNR
jgi:hypothetical protein